MTIKISKLIKSNVRLSHVHDSDHKSILSEDESERFAERKTRLKNNSIFNKISFSLKDKVPHETENLKNNNRSSRSEPVQNSIIQNNASSTATQNNGNIKNKEAKTPSVISISIYDKGKAAEVYRKIQAACKNKGIGYFLGGSQNHDTMSIHVSLENAEEFNKIVMESCSRNDVFRFPKKGSTRVEDLEKSWDRYEGDPFYDILVEEIFVENVSPKQRMFSRIEITFWRELLNYSTDDIVETVRENRNFSRVRRQTFEKLLEKRTDLDLETVNDAFQHNFPIDIVYTWVNDQDPHWMDKKERRSVKSGRSQSINGRANLKERFRNRDELRYSLRSIELFAPWVNHIYLVTDNQVPGWLTKNHPKLTVVDHKEIFRKPEALPCFNSSAIECQLHHIEGLSEHFIYFNDDVMLSQTTKPGDFFLANGQAKFFPSSQRANEMDIDDTREEYLIADANALSLFKRDFGFVARKTMLHTPHPSRRSVLKELEQRYQEEFNACSMQPFRSKFDLRPIAFMQYGYGFSTGKAIPSIISHRYIALWKQTLEAQLNTLIHQRHKKTLCINDVGVTMEREEIVDQLVKNFLNTYFPVKSSFEK